MNQLKFYLFNYASFEFVFYNWLSHLIFLAKPYKFLYSCKFLFKLCLFSCFINLLTNIFYVIFDKYSFSINISLNRSLDGKFVGLFRIKSRTSSEDSPGLSILKSPSIKRKNPKYSNTEPKKDKGLNCPYTRETTILAELFSSI